jgi:hypothetical protein
MDGLPEFSVLVRKHVSEKVWLPASDMILYYYDQIYPSDEPFQPKVSDYIIEANLGNPNDSENGK